MNLKSVCVYCSASNRVDGIYTAAAVELGKGIAQRGLRMVYGGGNTGLMGAVSNSVIDHGGFVTGFSPEHLKDRETPNSRVQDLHIVDTMHTRKQKMFEASDAFIVLPGGFGTLDETFEVITWRQLGLHDKPVVLVNINNYWTHLQELMERIIVEKFASDGHRAFYSFVDSVPEAFKVLENTPELQQTPDIRWV